MGQLIAVRCGPDAVSGALDAVWETGDAALLLPAEGPDAAIDGILAAQRPTAMWDLRADPAATPVRLETPRSDAEPPPDVHDDVALVVVTSGSTGTPKGVELTHSGLRAATSASLARLGCHPGQRWVLALPTHHVAGVQVVLRARALGGEPVLAPGIEDLARLAAQVDDAPCVSLVPTQLLRLLDARADVGRFATILLGGGPASPGLLERARTAGARLVTSYGMTETCGGCVYDGVPLADVEVDVVAGRIRIRGPVLLHGYRTAPEPGGTPATGHPQALDDDGWFTTRDVGHLIDGRLEVLGRADDVVVSGGENVPIRAVEAALRDAPGVADVAVTGRPDPQWGTAVAAVVVAHEPANPPTLEQLRAHVAGTLPRSSAPRHLVVVERLPRDAMGKLSRHALDRLVTDG